MRPLTLLALIIGCSPAFGSQIREIDVKTVSRLGAQLARLSDTADKGATTPARKRARDTAIAALKGKLFNIPYYYVVLDDPDGSGFLVYALAHSKTKSFSAAIFAWLSRPTLQRPSESMPYQILCCDNLRRRKATRARSQSQFRCLRL